MSNYRNSIIAALVEKNEAFASLITPGLPTSAVVAMAASQGIKVEQPCIEAAVVQYTTQDKGNKKGSCNTYLSVTPAGGRLVMLKLNDGPAITPEGKAKLTAVANAVADLLE